MEEQKEWEFKTFKAGLQGDGHTDMHEWLADRTTVNPTYNYNLVFARHVLEHSISPFALLVLLNKVISDNGHLVVVVPEDNLDMIKYKNHYSVLSMRLWERLFFKEGKFGTRGDGKMEWRYILKKVKNPNYD